MARISSRGDGAQPEVPSSLPRIDSATAAAQILADDGRALLGGHLDRRHLPGLPVSDDGASGGRSHAADPFRLAGQGDEIRPATKNGPDQQRAPNLAGAPTPNLEHHHEIGDPAV